MASTYLTRTPSTAGNRRTGTFSAWVKRGSLGTLNSLLDCYTSFELTWFNIRFSATDQIQAIAYDQTSGFQEQFELRPTRLFRDTSAWYHIVFSWDSTQATASDRVKFYVNGELETSFSISNYPALDEDFYINYNSIPYWIGRGGWNSNYFNGSMSYVAFVDGTAELPTIFGETDSVTGQWKIKTDITPSVAWGTNGFLILKNGNSLTDESTNSNNFTLGAGTLTNTLDCPSNVFATLNPLVKTYGTQVFSNGNTSSINSTNEPAWSHAIATLGASTGKYYWEIKVSGSTPWIWTGIISEAVDVSTQYLYNSNAGTFLYGNNGNKYVNASATSSFFATLATNDIVSVALNLDDNKITFYKNGTATPNATALDLPTNLSSTTVFPATTIVNGASIQSNFGNGYFGTTAVTTNSGNGYAGAEGASKFNYQPPTGYSALTTKGLNA